MRCLRGGGTRAASVARLGLGPTGARMVDVPLTFDQGFGTGLITPSPRSFVLFTFATFQKAFG